MRIEQAGRNAQLPGTPRHYFACDDRHRIPELSLRRESCARRARVVLGQKVAQRSRRMPNSLRVRLDRGDSRCCCALDVGQIPSGKPVGVKPRHGRRDEDADGECAGCDERTASSQRQCIVERLFRTAHALWFYTTRRRAWASNHNPKLELLEWIHIAEEMRSSAIARDRVREITEPHDRGPSDHRVFDRIRRIESRSLVVVDSRSECTSHGSTIEILVG